MPNAVYRCAVAGIVPIFRILFSRLSMLSSFYLSLEIYATAFVHHTALTDKDFKSESHLPVKFS